MERKIIIESTLDGSHTLYVPELDEHYHSTNGAMQESLHVFINAGLLYSTKQNLNILEIGFGTGLNAYLTYKAITENSRKVDYTTFELYPLSLDMIHKLNYINSHCEEDQDIYMKLHTSVWENLVEINSDFLLTKLQLDFSKLHYSFNKHFDVIYFDAFSPEKQPEMWSQEIFDYLYKYTSGNGILVTYCAKGVVRRMMQQAGYKVERLPGPPGKREMLRGLKN